MTLSEVLPSVRQLSLPEKRELVNAVTRDIEEQRMLEEMRMAASMPRCDLSGAYEVAANLQKIIDEQRD